VCAVGCVRRVPRVRAYAFFRCRLCHR
jgi:hypothetical protein